MPRDGLGEVWSSLKALYLGSCMGKLMADSSNGEQFDPSRAELFEALGHPVRIKILESLKEGPLGFAELKRRAGLESSGNLQFHLGKLGDLVRTAPDGDYCLTDEGREAIRVVEATERVASAEGLPRLRASLVGTRAKVSVLLVLLVLAGVAIVAEGSALGAETQVVPAGTLQLDSFILQPGQQHLLMGMGSPGWSGTWNFMGVVLTSEMASSAGVALEFQGEGLFNGTIAVVPTDEYVNANVRFIQGLAFTNCSAVNLSPDNVTVSGVYLQVGEVTHPHAGLGEDLLYLGDAVILFSAALLAWLLLRWRRSGR